MWYKLFTISGPNGLIHFCIILWYVSKGSLVEFVVILTLSKIYFWCYCPRSVHSTILMFIPSFHNMHDSCRHKTFRSIMKLHGNKFRKFLIFTKVCKAGMLVSVLKTFLKWNILITGISHLGIIHPIIGRLKFGELKLSFSRRYTLM